MRAIHLQPGPRGYAVIVGDIILADGLTAYRALRMVRGGKDLEPRFTGNHKLVPHANGRRVPRHTFSHNEAQAPHDFTW